jgi:hypothetical protein
VIEGRNNTKPKSLDTAKYVPTKYLSKGKIMHKKIEEKASKDLKKDAMKYKKDVKHAKTPEKKMHAKVEMKEAMSAAKDLKKRAKKAHEY